MISHSTRAKHRRNARRYLMLRKVQLTNLDRRDDAWLLSLPADGRSSWYRHLEYSDSKLALRAYREVLSVLVGRSDLSWPDAVSFAQARLHRSLA